MLKQMKYAFLEHRAMRIVSLSIFCGVMLPLLLLNRLFPDNFMLWIAAEICGGLGIAALYINILIMMILSQNRLFSKPRAYFTLMPPVHRWKIAVGTLAATALDIVVASALSAGVFYVGLGNMEWMGHLPVVGELIESGAVYEAIEGILTMIELAALMLFARTLTNTVFARLSGRKILGVLCFFGGMYALQFFNLLLIPFAGGQHGLSWGSLSIYIPYGNVVGSVAVIATLCVRIAALVIPTSILLEKKLNI